MVSPVMKLNEEEFYKWKELVLSSDFYEDIIKNRNVTEVTKNRYVLSLTTYCMYNNMSIDDLMKEADNEERANIRVKDRTILKRLNNFRDWMVGQGLQKLTCQTRFNDAKWSYRKRHIDIPMLDDDFKYPREKKLKYGDLPTTIDIQKAVDGTSALSNKALFLFIASSGTAKMETSKLTVQDFINATKDYHNEVDNIHNVLQILDGKKDIVPLFEITREKTDYDYYTCCSPEATQAIINLLQAQPVIWNEDPLFYLSYNGIGKAFQRANHKHNWGKIKNYYYFSSHRLRKRHASIVRDYDLANFLQGRKPGNKIKETYFLENPEEVKKEYLNLINKLTIYESNYKDIYSEEYKELKENYDSLKEDNEKVNDLMDKQKIEYEEKIMRLEALNDALAGKINNLEDQFNNLARSQDIERIHKYASKHELVNENHLMELVMAIYKEDIEKNKDLFVDESYIENIIYKAYNRELNDDLKTISDSENLEILGKSNHDIILNNLKSIAENYAHGLGFIISDYQEQKIHEVLWEYALQLAYIGSDEESIDEEDVIKLVEPILM